jgi:uncharacterized phage protein gp47/JayE
MISITDAGLEKNSLEENLEYVYAKIRGEKGPDVDLSPTGPWGQIAAMLAKFISDNDDQQEDIYISRDPDNSTGVSQDKLSAETGTLRKQATASVAEDVLLLGDEGTLIEAGNQITQGPVYEPPAELVFSLNDSVTISRSIARKVLLSLDEPSTGIVYTVTINGTPYTYVALITDNITTVIAALIALLPSDVTGTDEDSNLEIVGNDIDFVFGNSATLTMEELWVTGDFTANLTGAINVPAKSLTEIVTPVSGWADVINPGSGITGLEKETDAQLIIRRKNELIKGKGTDAAVRNAVFNVVNVTTSNVVSNRTDLVVDGLPPHSFETIVSGGLDDDVAQAILDNMPSGIEPFGINDSGQAVDEQGQEFTIPFSRPTFTYLHVRYTRTQHPEEAYPDDGDALVKQNLLDWASTNISSGTDVVRQKLETPFFEVPGSQSVVTEFAETVNPGDSPSWGTGALISVPANKTAVFEEDRIFVVTV